MKALFKKYDSLSRKANRAYALLEDSGFFKMEEENRSEEQKQAFAAYRAAREEFSAFTADLNKWQLVRIGWTSASKKDYVRPINQAVIDHLKKRQKEQELKEIEAELDYLLA